MTTATFPLSEQTKAALQQMAQGESRTLSAFLRLRLEQIVRAEKQKKAASDEAVEAAS